MIDPMIQDTDPSDILIVDDAPDSLELLGRILEERGHRVRAATNGRHALKSVAARLPVLILLDVKMPEMDGYEVCRRLKAGEQSRNVPVIFISAHGETAEKVHGFKVGAVDFITKPYEEQEVLARVQTHLRLRELTEHLEQKVTQRTAELTLANRQLRQQIHERERAQEALSREAEINLAAAELSRKLLSPASIDGISSLVLEQAKRLTGSAFGFVGHIDPKTGFLVVPTLTRDIWDQCQVTDKDIVFKKFTGLWGWVLENRKPLMTNAAVDDPRSAGIPLGHIPIHRFLSAPALISETLVGQVAVANPDHDYSERDIQLIERLAHLYAIAIQRQRIELINNTLFRIANAINTTANLEELYASIHDTLGAVIDTTNFYIALYHKATNSISFPYFEDEMDNDFAYIRDFTTTNSLTGEVILSRAPLFLTQEMLLERAEKEQILGTAPKIWLGVPLIIKDDVIGVMAVQSYSDTERFKKADLAILKAVAGQIATVIDRKRAEDELKKHRDQLEELVKARTSELEVANKELAVAKEQAEAANASKSDFLARMSHDIRTPLNAVTGLTQIVLKSDLKDEQRDYLNKVQLAAGNLMEVINDILDFSKVEAGRLELKHAPFDLEQVMAHLESMFGVQAVQKNLELVFTMAPHVPRQLTGDAGRLTQVLTNLIANAVKYTDQGKVTVDVDVTDRVPKGQAQTALTFQVTDTGVGIAADVLPTLFDPFTQADASLTRRHEGTGLGLAICRQLATLMGGRIWAESTPGQGSTFSFTAMMEIRMEEPEAVTPQRPQEPAALLIQRLAGHRVLVVEDSELNRDVAVALLEEADLAVETAENGQVAVDKLTGSEPEYYDAVLMDIQMPVMDGYEATRHIREWEADAQFTNHRIPIIALTAHALKGEKEKCLAADMDDYLPKPLDEQDLHRLLLKWL